jgi:hypothetical protein
MPKSGVTPALFVRLAGQLDAYDRHNPLRLPPTFKAESFTLERAPVNGSRTF